MTPPIQTHTDHGTNTDWCCSFYRNPDDDKEREHEESIAKVERAAAQRRSNIRRDPPPRPRHQSSSVGLTNIIRSRARQRAHQDDTTADRRIEILEAELEQLRRQRNRTTSGVRVDRARQRFVSDRTDTSGLSAADTILADDLLNALGDEGADVAANRVASENVALPRPTRESNLRFELASQDAADGSNASNMPSPPRSVGDSGGRPVDGPLEPWNRIPPLTRGFAPAQAAQAAQRSDVRDTENGSQSELLRQARAVADVYADTATNNEESGLETPPPEGWENSYPPLRRVPHMSPRPLPRTASPDTMNGLGDRRRSPSPISETHEEVTWNNILATMEDDHNPSSASTSFASTAVSQISSNTSFGEIGSASDDGCDLPPGITAAEARRLRMRHQADQSSLRDRENRRPGYTQRRRNLPDGPLPGPTQNEDLPLSVLIEEARALRERREARRDDETLMYRAISERMQRHEHVPDEWWALAGLSDARV